MARPPIFTRSLCRDLPSSQPRKNSVNTAVRLACGPVDAFDVGCGRIYSEYAGTLDLTLDLEAFMRVAFAALIVMMLLPTPAAPQVVDLSTIRCKEFLDSSKETIAYIMMWLDGYFTGEDDPAVVDFDRMKQKGEKLGEYCAKNPTHGLLTAAEEVMGK
jgi:acid stress chaperone HdeB